MSLLHPDIRSFAEGEDRVFRCRSCSSRIRARPEDRRDGYCYDHVDLTQLSGRYPPIVVRSS